jgi:hypothetical protein
VAAEIIEKAEKLK